MPEDSASHPTAGLQEEGSMSADIAEVLTMRRKLQAIEAGIVSEMSAVREHWRAWAHTQVDRRTGRFEGTFTGKDSDGKPLAKRVFVHLEYDSGFPYTRLNMMYIADEAGWRQNGEAPGVMMNFATFSIGRVMFGSSSRIKNERSISWGNIREIGFDGVTKEYPAEAPNFGAVARQELEWLKGASGSLEPTTRVF